MKILVTLPDLSKAGGITRFVLSLSNILINNKYEVYILTTHGNNTDDVNSTGNQFEQSIKLIKIHTKNKIERYLKTLFTIQKLRPDIIINNYDGLIQYLLPFINNKIKIIHILHNDTDDFYRIGSINARRVNLWIAPTSGIAKRFNLYTKNKFKSKTFVISHGVDDAQHLSEREDIVLNLLFAGVLYEHKGVKELPIVIKQLKKHNINFHFTIIGAGILENWLKEQFEEEINSGFVEFTGVIDHEDVYSLMKKADIFYYPTHVDAFGLVIAEAMMNGAVPVVSHIDGVTDNLIDDEKNGYLIPIGDTDGFINRIVELNDNKKLLNSLSIEAHKKAKNKFSFENMEKNYLNIINNLFLS